MVRTTDEGRRIATRTLPKCDLGQNQDRLVHGESEEWAEELIPQLTRGLARVAARRLSLDTVSNSDASAPRSVHAMTFGSVRSIDAHSRHSPTHSRHSRTYSRHSRTYSRHSRTYSHHSHTPPSFPLPPTSFPRRRESPPPCIAFDKTEPTYYHRTMTTPRNHKPKEIPPCANHTNPQPPSRPSA